MNEDRIREYIGMSEEEREIARLPILEVLNFGRTSRVRFCGIDFSLGVRSAAYQGHAPSMEEPNRLLIDIEIDTLMRKLANLTDEEIERVKKKLAPYKVKSQP